MVMEKNTKSSNVSRKLFKTKDCFFGQVRAVTETFNGTPNTWTPEVLNVSRQCGVTWDNTTGMNPLYDKANIDLNYYSYGEVLSMVASKEYSFVNDFIEPMQTPEFYDNKIKENYENHYARLAFLFATPWGIDQLLAQEGNDEFDFIVVRQFDTFWRSANPEITDRIRYIFDEGSQLLSERTDKIHNIPIAYALAKNLEDYPSEYVKFPVIGCMHSSVIIFNRAAMNILRQKYFNLALAELEIMYKQTNTDLQSRIHNWEPGYNIHRILTKCNIHIIDINSQDIVGLKPGWNVACGRGSAHLSRTTGASN